MIHTDGDFRGWKRVITSEELSTENLNRIADASLYQDAACSGDNYPTGITTIYIAKGSTGYPHEFGEVLNVKSSVYRFAQFFFLQGIPMKRRFIFVIGTMEQAQFPQLKN